MTERLILIDGDEAEFLPTFELATVVPRRGKLAGTGQATLNKKKLCVQGDEDTVLVVGCPYTTKQYPVPGTGTLRISGLEDDQKAKKTKTGGKAVLLKGKTTFKAIFEVQKAATEVPKGPPPPEDKTLTYKGNGLFITTNTKFTGT